MLDGVRATRTRSARSKREQRRAKKELFRAARIASHSNQSDTVLRRGLFPICISLSVTTIKTK